MPVSLRGRKPASRPFVTTPYDGSAKEITAAIPLRGPCWRDDSPCRIGQHHCRTRKTGPHWGWVAVARCATHGRAFTVYPPGQVPYGRTPLIELAPDGSALRSGEAATRPATPLVVPAARDAANGTRWPREEAADAEGGVRSTQHRQVARAAAMLGLVVGTPPTPALVASVTGLGEGQLVGIAARLASTHDLKAWGDEVARVAAKLECQVPLTLLDRLAVLGHLAGRWGRPYRWLPGPRRLLELGRRLWSSAPTAAGTPDHMPIFGGPSEFNDFGSRGPP